VKILDFGLARREEDGEAHLTQSGAIVGTPAYMAPEQASGEKLDGRADLFSLGVLLYRLTTGQAAFTGPTTTAMLLQVMTHEPGLASEVKPTVPLEMARIIAKLMAKKREDRYGSAAEFLAEWDKLPKAPKPEPPTEAFVQANEPRPSGSGKQVATRDIAPLPDGRGSLGRWVLLGGVGLLVVALAAWFLIPRGTNPPVAAKKNNEPPPVVPAAKEPPPLDHTNAQEVQSAWAAKLKVAVEEKSPTGIVMVLIPPGKLVKYPYRLGKYEVTQAEWQKVMNYNPSQFKGPNLPVENVSWFDSVEFCNKLSEREKLPPYYALEVKTRKGNSIEEAEVKILGGPGYHIPTDAEWEHGCRAGTRSKYCFGDDDAQLAEYAWYDQTSGKKTHPVGELKPNGFGLYDIHGNVREWNEEMLKNATTGAPERVSRGGSWNNTAAHCAVSPRYRLVPAHRHINHGLRVSRVP
jgi:formylglycine-generating enzyme required for sulfatase activity